MSAAPLGFVARTLRPQELLIGRSPIPRATFRNVRPLIPTLLLALALPLFACGKSNQDDSSTSDAGIGGHSADEDDSDGGGSGGSLTNSDGGETSSGGGPLTNTGGVPSSGGDGALGGEGPSLSGGAAAQGGSGGSTGGATNGCETPASGCLAEDELVCDDLGQLQRCDACLQHQPEGEECLRLLAIDRESGMMCAVRGTRELVCVGGEYDWKEPHWGSFQLPEAPTDFALSEMTTTASLPESCWINAAKEAKCSWDPEEIQGVDCAHVLAASGPAMVAICDGSLVSSNLAIATDPVPASGLALSDLTVIWLDPSGNMQATHSSNAILEGSFVDLVLSDLGGLCGIRDDGALVCLHYEGQGPFELAGNFTQVGGSGDNVKCSLGGDGTIACFSLDETGFSPAFSPTGNHFVSLVSGHNESCARTRAGAAVCWNEEGLVTHEAPLFD